LVADNQIGKACDDPLTEHSDMLCGLREKHGNHTDGEHFGHDPHGQHTEQDDQHPQKHAHPNDQLQHVEQVSGNSNSDFAPAVQPTFDAVPLIGQWVALPDNQWRTISDRFASFRTRDEHLSGHRRLEQHMHINDDRLRAMMVEVWPSVAGVMLRREFQPKAAVEVVHRSGRHVLRVVYVGYGDRADHDAVQPEIRSMRIRGLGEVL
jgi:hypothetical protein